MTHLNGTGSSPADGIYLKAKNQSDSIRGSVNDYYKRMAEFRENLDKQIKEKNDYIIQRKLSGIENMYFGNDVTKLSYGNAEIASLLKFGHNNKFNKSLEGAISNAKKQQSVIEEKITKIKQGETDGKEVKIDTELKSLKDFKNRDFMA